MGLERIVLLMEQQAADQLPVGSMDVFLAALSADTLPPCSQLAHMLRKQGAKVAIDYSGRSLKAQLKQASRVNARFALIVGDDEWARGEAILRNMQTQEQQIFALQGETGALAHRLLAVLRTPAA